MDDLIERLRKTELRFMARNGHHHAEEKIRNPDGLEAAARIEADIATITTLREALEKIVRIGDWNNYAPDLRRIARAALANTGISNGSP